MAIKCPECNCIATFLSRNGREARFACGAAPDYWFDVNVDINNNTAKDKVILDSAGNAQHEHIYEVVNTGGSHE